MSRIFHRPLRRGKFALPLALLLLALCHAGPAYAHALLLRSDPAQDALLPDSPRIIHLWFSENLNPGASKIVVWNRYRRTVSIGQATVVPGQPKQLEVRVQTLPAGTYLVLWTSVSAVDGHILHGFYLFSVKVRGPGPSLSGVSQSTSQEFPDAPTLASLLAHWVELLAAVTWVGAAIFSDVVFRPRRETIDENARAAEERRIGRLIVGALVALFLASGVLIVIQMYTYAGNDWGSAFTGTTLREVFSDQYGQLWLARQAIVLLVLALLWLPLRALTRRFGAAFLIGSGVVYLYLFAGSGHAASAQIGDVAGTNILSAGVLVDWVHYLADAAWFGGQTYIVLVLIPALRLRNEPTHTGAFLRILDRFSPVAYACVGGYIVSGVFAAKIHIPSWYAFFQSVYGRTLIVKVTLVGLMMLVSVGTVFLIRPRIRHTMRVEGEEVTRVSAFLMRRLLNWLRVNPVLGAGVLLATSILFYYPVPVGFAPAGPSAYTAHGGGLTATLTITPDRSGPNTITVALRNKQGQPVRQASVRVLTNMLEMVMGQGLAALSEKAPGRFSGTTDLGMGGRWRLTILVYQPSAFTRLNVDVEVGS